MIIESATPNNKLNDLIKEFVLLSNDSKEIQSIISVDDACNDFMFLQGSTITIEYGNKKITKTDLPVYTHRLEPPMEFFFDSQISYFIIKVQPWANSVYFPYEAPYGIKDVREIYGESIIALHNRIFIAESFDECVQASEEFLSGLNFSVDSNMNLVKNICGKIYETKGMITVNELADTFEMSRQTLNKVFFLHVNYTTKYFIILVRILSATKFKLNNPSYSLTEVAYEFGYTDQSHFIYDFKRISGVAPSQLFKNLPTFLQRHKK